MEVSALGRWEQILIVWFVESHCYVISLAEESQFQVAAEASMLVLKCEIIWRAMQA